jgi:CheY-like chemotaxis protein
MQILPPALSRPPASDASPVRPARALRLLVAEDNTINQKLITRVLGQLGHSGVMVGNGEQALRALAAQRFDMVLMDDHMPVMTGMQALKALRASEPQARPRTPVIVVTANDMAGDREDYLRRGASGYLAKPVRAEALQAEIERVLACKGCWPYACGGSPAGNAASKHCLSADRVHRTTSTMVSLINLPTRTEQRP